MLPNSSHRTVTDTQPNPDSSITVRNTDALSKARRIALLTCFAIVFVSQVLGALMATPVLRLFEMSACRDYYRAQDPSKIGDDGNVPESLCKVAPVQKEVAFVNSMLFSIASGISLAVTIPFGIVADRYGRKIVLGLNLAAEVIFYLLIGIIGYFPNIFPTRAYIFTALLQLMGGGGKVVSAIIYSIMADVSTEEERPKLFYYLEIVDYGTQLIVPAIVSVVMHFSIWIPFMIGVIASTVSFVAVMFLPETVAKKARKRELAKFGTEEEEELLRSLVEESRPFLDDISGARPTAEADQGASPLIPEAEAVPPTKKVRTSWILNLKTASKWFVDTFQPFGMLKPGCKTTCFVLFVALSLWSVAWTSHLFFQLYASQRFDISLAQSGLIMSYKSFIDILLFSLILPRLRYFLARHPLVRSLIATTSDIDLTILRLSTLGLALGFIIIGLASNEFLFMLGITIVALGDGFNVTAQAMIITLADPTVVGQICSWFALVTTAGRTLGRLIIMVCFRKGTDADELGLGFLVGLPFDVAGILCVLTALVLCVPLRLPQGEKVGNVNYDSEETDELNPDTTDRPEL